MGPYFLKSHKQFKIMSVNEKVAIEHGLKADEYKKICKLLENP